MKFFVITALVGLSESVKVRENMRTLKASNNMRDICKDYMNIEVSKDVSFLQLDQEMSVANETSGEQPAEEKPAETKRIEGTHKEHYGKTKEEIDAENKKILDTQAKCLDFVKTHQGHPEICEWCQNEYKKPAVVWRWNPDENVWYRWYDGGWHYWGPSKDGFTTDGWTWYNGYWHHGGYVYKYEDGHWWRFQDGKWVIYAKEIPVSPEKPTGGKICRPFYKMMKQGFPESLASQQVERCKVGENIYMWTDDAACKFLGGTKIMQDRVVCKSGEEHKWKRVVKCVQGNSLLSNGGLDYKTGQLASHLYNFQQCKTYGVKPGGWFLYLNGEMRHIPANTNNEGFIDNVYVKPRSALKITYVTREQLQSKPLGKEFRRDADLVEYHGSFFLNDYTLMEFSSEEVFTQCQFNKAAVKQLSDKEFEAKQMGDMFVV